MSEVTTPAAASDVTADAYVPMYADLAPFVGQTLRLATPDGEGIPLDFVSLQRHPPVAPGFDSFSAYFLLPEGYQAGQGNYYIRTPTQTALWLIFMVPVMPEDMPEGVKRAALEAAFHVRVPAENAVV